MTAKKVALLPCPFCGSAKVRMHWEVEAAWRHGWAQCGSCNVEGVRGPNRVVAARNWNRRAGPQDSALDDGFGNVWEKCPPFDKCRLQIVRPGKVQCDCARKNAG